MSQLVVQTLLGRSPGARQESYTFVILLSLFLSKDKTYLNIIKKHPPLRRQVDRRGTRWPTFTCRTLTVRLTGMRSFCTYLYHITVKLAGMNVTQLAVRLTGASCMGKIQDDHLIIMLAIEIKSSEPRLDANATKFFKWSLSVFVKYIAKLETGLGFEQLFKVFVKSLDQICVLLVVPACVRAFAQNYLKWLETCTGKTMYVDGYNTLQNPPKTHPEYYDIIFFNLNDEDGFLRTLDKGIVAQMRKDIKMAEVDSKNQEIKLLMKNHKKTYGHEHVKNVRATARRFEIEPKQVREWVKKKQDLLNVAPYILTLNRGRQAHFPLLEEKLVKWINERRNEQNAVTRNMAVKKDRYPNIGNFKFSRSWLGREFLSFILFKRREYNFPVKFIGNMDETPLSFDMPSPVTIEKRGSKTVAMCIFKLKTIPRDVFPPNVIIRVNEKGWCNEHEMHYWINNVWTRCSEVAKPESLLVLDSFRGHLMDSVTKPSYGTLAQWVRDSWEEVDIHLIVKAFKCCGVSVEMDGTEDDVVFDYELLDENKNDGNSEVMNFTSIDGEEYEEVGGSNVWE
ncbi:9673_t:CDS:10 [Paraglomus brasilianum]|uniref:9673_t:CDS:1 n=1 Tax=Paraglomus brasilianum TaxID=144538 RepID=A0A9N9GUP8_9GLOM|nr:9673_t:CDS:10 [Paraglomus brasilianum]